MKTYRSRENIREMFWDFYALHELWFNFGGGVEKYYGRSIKIVPEQRSSKIRSSYFDSIHTFFPIIYDALERSCRKEIEHAWCSEFRINDIFIQDYKDLSPHKKKTYDDIDEIICTKNSETISVEEMHEIFSAVRGWECSFGGEKWAKGTQALMELKGKLNTFDESWALHIDRILDLRHNTGVMLNKTEFSIITNDILNKRKGIRRTAEYLRYPASRKVKGLIKNSSMYF